ncbi:cysteine--tRNA ligase [Candidatus Woesearchaeota archaeon]|nr:cysteine--tRNA ligase [Candidatus Woesearchaeota archaeon]
MGLKLYNTLSRKKEEFVPLEEGKVGMYCCGPTVYDFAHIGNLRAYIFQDVLRRALLLNQFKLKQVMNITDVGHLTSDADEGEDKLMKALRREGKEPSVEAMMELAEKYTNAFMKDIKSLNIQEPELWCKATEHIPEMIELVKRIEENGYAYKTKVGLIFDTAKFSSYAELGRLRLEEQKAGARVAVDEERKSPSDFALWLTNQPNHLMQWDSPWGRGFPGWHLECSAMSMKYLGEQFDIHCGGIDHVPVHHTNEVAQSEAATGKHPWVKYWLHNEFLVLEKGKMAKSEGGFITLQAVADKGYDTFVYRYLCLGAHYRQQLKFSWDGMEGAKNTFNRLKEKILELKDRESVESETELQEEKTDVYLHQFIEAINDDLNTPRALSVMWSVLRDEEIDAKEKLALMCRFDEILGLGFKEWEREKVKAPQEVLELLDKREEARKNKDWELADKARDKIKKAGYAIDDTPDGARLKKL